MEIVLILLPIFSVFWSQWETGEFFPKISENESKYGPIPNFPRRQKNLRYLYKFRRF